MDMKPFRDLMRGLSGSQQGEIIGKLISEAVNCSGAGKCTNAINDAIRSEHRYLQHVMYQGVFELIKGAAKDYDNKRYDGRNEFYVRLCKLINTEILESKDIRGMLPPDEVGY